MGADITIDNNTISVEQSELNPIEIEICADISSAAYFMVAGLIIPKSKIVLMEEICSGEVNNSFEHINLAISSVPLEPSIISGIITSFGNILCLS